jgi:hypothetical protein
MTRPRESSRAQSASVRKKKPPMSSQPSIVNISLWYVVCDQ